MEALKSFASLTCSLRAEAVKLPVLVSGDTDSEAARTTFNLTQSDR